MGSLPPGYTTGPSYTGVTINIHSGVTGPLSIGGGTYDFYPTGISYAPVSQSPGTPEVWGVNLSASTDTPTFNIALGRYGAPTGNQAIVALATAKNGSTSISLATAAAELGVNHFNVVQVLLSDPDLTACGGKNFPTGSAVCDSLTTISGSVPPNGTLDPPLGGWKYQADEIGGFPAQDYHPFYWDEYFPSPSDPEYLDYQVIQATLPSNANDFVSAPLSSAMGYELYDQPGQSYPGTSEFVDFLVGVKGDCNNLSSSSCTYIPITDADFLWTSTNGVVVASTKNTTVNSGMVSLTLDPLGCGDPICGEDISLDEALALTGNTLTSFENLGSSVPEPSTWALIVLGFAGLGYAHFRRCPTARLA